MNDTNILQKEKQYVFEDPKSTTSDPDGSKYSSQEWLDSIADTLLSENRDQLASALTSTLVLLVGESLLNGIGESQVDESLRSLDLDFVDKLDGSLLAGSTVGRSQQSVDVDFDLGRGGDVVALCLDGGGIDFDRG